MKRSFVGISILIALLASGLTACKVGREYERPTLNTVGLFRDVPGTDTTTLASVRWNDVFTDTTLQRLIREGIENNLDLRIAYTRVRAAEAFYNQSSAAFGPTVSANFSVTESKLNNVQGFGIRNAATQFQTGLTASWEADIWGRLGSAKRASLASLLQSRAYARAVQTGIVSAVVGYYYTLVALDRQLAITEQTVQNRIKTVETIKALKEAAVLTGAAVVQSEALRYQAEVLLPDLRQRIRETENALSIVLGRAPERIERSTLDAQTLTAAIAAGVPAQLLANRPDVQQAEYNYRSFFEQTNVARASFYPSLTISGAAGLSSLVLNTFFSSGSIFANLAGGLAQPILNRRLNRTRLEVAQAQQQEALFVFQGALLTAGQEVSNALSLYATAVEKRNARTNQLVNLSKSVEFTQELLQFGSANYTEVINAQQSLLDAQLNAVNDRLQELQATVSLYRALGGGWK